MAGKYTKPKARNRKFVFKIGEKWYPVCYGISSRGNNFSESKEEYHYMCGGSDTEPTEQSVTRNFSGNRFIGDPVQDAIFIDMLFDLDHRNVEVYEFYDNMPTDMVTAKGNGWSYNGTITISDDGSGDAPNRETIAFDLDVNGEKKRGTVVVTSTEEEPTYAFTPLTGGA